MIKFSSLQDLVNHFIINPGNFLIKKSNLFFCILFYTCPIFTSNNFDWKVSLNNYPVTFRGEFKRKCHNKNKHFLFILVKIEFTQSGYCRINIVILKQFTSKKFEL